MTAVSGLGRCPACQHDLSANVGGLCSVFVPLPPESGRLAGYCGCDCVKATTGESWQAGFARALRVVAEIPTTERNQQ